MKNLLRPGLLDRLLPKSYRPRLLDWLLPKSCLSVFSGFLVLPALVAGELTTFTSPSRETRRKASESCLLLFYSTAAGTHIAYIWLIILDPSDRFDLTKFSGCSPSTRAASFRMAFRAMRTKTVSWISSLLLNNRVSTSTVQARRFGATKNLFTYTVD